MFHYSRTLLLPRFSQVFLGLLIVLSYVLFLSSNPCWAKITVSNLFSDHMVIQRNEPIRIWGKANPKEILGVRIGENKVVAFADKDGNWQAELKPMKAGGPYELQIVGSEKVVVRDILVGEVWLCSGQSNMALNNRDSHLADRIDGQVYNENMRFISLPPRVSSKKEWLVDAKWKHFNSETALDCSAVGTAFAVRLSKEIDCPIGIIVAAVGGSPIQPWLSRSGLDQYPDGRTLIRKVDGIVSGLKKRGFNTRNLVVDQVASKKKKLIDDPSRQLFLSPTTLFNTMIAPLVPYSIKGVLWYQGEANVYESSDYQGLFTKLIKDWRKKWMKPHLPFFYVQLAPVGKLQAIPVKTSPVADLRFAQFKSGVLPFSYMAVTLDCIDDKAKPDWHASDKIKIGNRLATMALASQYNKPYPYKSPSIFTYELKDNKVVLHFKNANHSLAKQGGELSGFAISGSDENLVWAKAMIEGETVVVWNDKIEKPRFVYYAWADNPRGNLTGSGDLPAVPFQLELD